MTRIIISILFLLAIVNGCKTEYAVSERQSGYLEIKNTGSDESIDKMIQPYRDSISAKMNEVIGISEMVMETGQPESLLGNFVCDLVYQYEFNEETSRDREGQEYIFFVLLNYRGLRAPLPPGDIKVKNIYEIMPFENTLVYVDLKGSTLMEMAEFLIDVGGHPVSSNYSLSVNADKTFKLAINGNAIDTSAIYTIITTDYLLGGGDKMNFFSKAVSKTETNYKLRDLIIDQIKLNTKKGITNTTALDGRITFK